MGKLYVLWGETTTRFKVGYTARSVAGRAATIEAYSPVGLRVVASKPGTMQDERDLHHALRDFRCHGEWFELPEDAVWWLLAQFGIQRAEIESASGQPNKSYS